MSLKKKIYLVSEGCHPAIKWVALTRSNYLLLIFWEVYLEWYFNKKEITGRFWYRNYWTNMCLLIKSWKNWCARLEYQVLYSREILDNNSLQVDYFEI